MTPAGISAKTVRENGAERLALLKEKIQNNTDLLLTLHRQSTKPDCVDPERSELELLIVDLIEQRERLFRQARRTIARTTMLTGQLLLVGDYELRAGPTSHDDPKTTGDGR